MLLNTFYKNTKHVIEMHLYFKYQIIIILYESVIFYR